MQFIEVPLNEEDGPAFPLVGDDEVPVAAAPVTAMIKAPRDKPETQPLDGLAVDQGFVGTISCRVSLRLSSASRELYVPQFESRPTCAFLHGAQLVVGDYRGTVRAWNVPAHAPFATFFTCSSSVVHLNTDGTKLVAGYYNGRVDVFDMMRGMLLHSLTTQRIVHSSFLSSTVYVSPRVGATLDVARNATVLVGDRPLRLGTAVKNRLKGFSAALDGQAWLWVDAASPLEAAAGRDDAVKLLDANAYDALCMDAKHTRVAMYSRQNNLVHIFNADSGRSLHIVALDTLVDTTRSMSVEFMPSSTTRLLVCTPLSMHVVDFCTSQKRALALLAHLVRNGPEPWRRLPVDVMREVKQFIV